MFIAIKKDSILYTSPQQELEIQVLDKMLINIKLGTASLDAIISLFAMIGNKLLKYFNLPCSHLMLQLLSVNH